ncbi:MAG: methylmalonyl Co-A mutase-associated GTPase MeaB [Euryarchaeota archaeon]|nr:methylmalonyl Co-A mutase-associated GTPase MeaB [Euryarchaeota archaeon]|tara:strand:- start:78731 stop:79609 length:879 start_codon:yes stop_codon:yes gene_type:complete
MAMMPIGELLRNAKSGDRRSLARLLTKVEQGEPFEAETKQSPWILGVTGAPGVGKSTMIDRLASKWSQHGWKVAILAVDPSSPISGGALLGDRARMAYTNSEDVYFRSISSKGHQGGISTGLGHMAALLTECGWDRIIIETVGVGQGEYAVISVADRILLVDGPDRGDTLQAEKAGILELADVVACNKSDLPGSAQAVQSLEEGLSLSSDPPDVVSVSSLTGDGIEALIEVIEALKPNNKKNKLKSRIILDSIIMSRIRSLPVYGNVVEDITSKKIAPMEGAKIVEGEYGRF